MQPASRYRDLLWDFSYEGISGKRSEVTLRVFNSEQEMFEHTWQSDSEFPVSLPMDWLSGGPKSQGKRSRLGIPNSLQEYEDIGLKLWEAIPKRPKKGLLEATDEQPCRLKISSNSELIDDLPWEWLNDVPNKTPISLRTETRIVRSIPIRLTIPPKSVDLPIRVLVVLTNPKDERLLDARREIEAVLPDRNNPRYSISILEEPTWEALLRALQKEPHIVHYIGHAGVSQGGGNLILHDWQNRTHWIAGQEFAQSLPLSVRLLCLSTCFTASNYQILGLPRLAHTSARYQLPTTVTNRYEVEEISVHAFWQTFYRSLTASHGSVNEAFREAQMATRFLGNAVDWGSFSLVIRDQSGEALQLEAEGESSKEKYTTEIQAQLASRLANDLAERLKGFGAAPADVVKKQYEVTATRASKLVERLSGRGNYE